MLIRAHSSAVHFATGQREPSAWQCGGLAWWPGVAAGGHCWVSDTELSTCEPLSWFKLREGELARLSMRVVRFGARSAGAHPPR